MEKGQKFILKEVSSYQDNSIVSSKIVENSSGGIICFAFSKGQRLSEHTAPFDAMVYVTEGQGEVVIDGVIHLLNEGECVIMPAHVPHAVNAAKAFKMMLVMIKG